MEKCSENILEEMFSPGAARVLFIFTPRQPSPNWMHHLAWHQWKEPPQALSQRPRGSTKKSEKEGYRVSLLHSESLLKGSCKNGHGAKWESWRVQALNDREVHSLKLTNLHPGDRRSPQYIHRFVGREGRRVIEDPLGQGSVPGFWHSIS